jgi:[acyl-carrier-protein] S-malonyltransferase
MSRSLALLFPGQGSQFVGMGKALAQQFPVAAQVFAEADEA